MVKLGHLYLMEKSFRLKKESGLIITDLTNNKTWVNSAAIWGVVLR